ncbi:MAG: rhodanese-like domain-containing protein [candidate division Zixibacteria bacterium]|nr:rhodanese-like domain-containing protein [candidate division Zixibacteria bacterium]
MSSNKSIFKFIFQAVLIVVFSLFIGVIYNIFSKGGISIKGSWSNKVFSDSLVVPYSYDKADPPAITLTQAMTYFQTHNTIFLDARLEGDYKAGHIPKALNLPFDEFDQYYPKVELLLTKDKNIITYCDGTECEASLFLARILKERGFKNLKIFFGGWTEWNKAGLPVERSL